MLLVAAYLYCITYWLSRMPSLPSAISQSGMYTTYWSVNTSKPRSLESVDSSVLCTAATHSIYCWAGRKCETCGLLSANTAFISSVRCLQILDS